MQLYLQGIYHANIHKMTRLSKKLNETKITQKAIAIALDTTEKYVNDVLTGRRKGLWGKGLQIKEYVNKLISEQNEVKRKFH